MTCADNIQNLITQLNDIVVNNSDVCCTEYITPDLSATITSIQNDCVAVSPISSPNDSNVYCVHNFDIPVHTFCEYLFRGSNTDVSKISTSCLWKSIFENTTSIPPRIDTLQPTNKSEYYVLQAWCSMLSHYIQTAQTVNTNDIGTLQNAFLMLTDEEHYLNEEMDTLHADQCDEDTLQDAIDNPTEAWLCVREQTRNDVRERMQCNRAKRRRRGERSSTRSHQRQQKLFVPLGRSKMGCFEHSIVDARFQQNIRDVEQKLKNVHNNKEQLEERKTLAQTIQKTLRQLKHIFHNLYTLIFHFLKEWETRQIVCNATSLPLTRRMTFQQQLKSTLFDAKALMKQQVFQHRWQLCEDVPYGCYDYYPYFNYSIQSSLSVRTLPSIDVVLKASNSLLLYTHQQIVLQLLQTATYLETGSVITREQIVCMVGQLENVKSVYSSITC